MDKRNVVLVGAGKRAERVILPALWCLQDEMELSAVLGRTVRKKSFLSGRWELSVRTHLSDSDWAKVDLLVIAVPKEAVGSVLRTVPLAYRSRITLLIDTPAIPLRHLGIVRLLASFKQALVSEDYIGLPFFEAALTLLQEGKIGRLQSVLFEHSGYRYHALAAIKRLSGSNVFPLIRMSGRDKIERKIRTGNGIIARVIEPRDYSIGKTLITGTAGSIGDYPSSAPNHFFLENLGTHVRLNGMLISGDKTLDAALQKYGAQAVPEESMDAAKTYGFMRLVCGAFNSDSPYRYSPVEGIYDYLASILPERIGWFLDISFGSTSLMKFLIRRLGALLPA